MRSDRISELRSKHMRCVEDLCLRLDGGTTVLIGDNGSGKSTILEALELLHRLANGQAFMDELNVIHGGLQELTGGFDLGLGLTMSQGAGSKLEYDVLIAGTFHGAARFLRETLVEHAAGQENILLQRSGEAIQYPSLDAEGLRLPSSWTDVEPLLPFLFTDPADLHPAALVVRRMLDALRGIEVKLAFDVTPAWVTREQRRVSPLRTSMRVLPAGRLDRSGENLVNVYNELRNSGEWDDVLASIRLGLGDWVEQVQFNNDPAGGAQALSLKVRHRELVLSTSQLSDGQLAYLAFVALAHLRRGRSLLAFDEPELHLHPGLVVRAAQLIDRVADDHPVVLATHSDHLLDALRDPAASVRICELDETTGYCRVRELDTRALEEWRADFGGLGALRSEGFLPHVTRAGTEQ